MINNNGNNDKSHNNQFKQLQQMSQIQMNMNNGKKTNLTNDRFNYSSPGIMGIMNNQMKNNNLMYNLNQNQNNAQDNNTIKEMNNGANLDNNDEINNNEEMFNEQLNIDSSNYPDKAFNQAQSKMINNKNINQNINHMNSYQINLLKNNLFNKFNNKPKMDYGIEIPVELIKSTENNSNQGLGKFMKQNNIPIINLDLTNNKLLELEYKIIELKEKIKEKNKSVLNLEKELRINDEKIKKNSKELKGKEEEFKYYSLLNNQHKEEILKLNNIKKELIGKMPPDQISLKSNKNISYSQYKQLKFEPPEVDDNYIYKTLQKDLTDYEKYMDYLIYKKKPKILSLLTEITLIIKEIDPNYELKVFGSYAYGLSLPWSNLNLILVNKNKNINNKTGENAKEDNLTDIETTSETQNDNLSHANTNSNTNKYNESNNNNNNYDDIERTDLLVNLILYFRNINWIKKSNISQIEDINFISLITNEEYDKIEVNISMESKNHNGLKVVELIKSYIKEYSVLKPLYFALRTLLKNANLHIASSGGLCAYGLILMLVSFIQSQRDSNKIDNEYIIGKTFYEFLLHYGIKFDFNKYVILTYKINETNTSTNEKDVYNAGQNAKEFMIVDPLNDKNNVAKSTYQFMNIKMALLIAFQVTKEDCDCGCHYGKAFYENNFTSIEHSYLKRIFNSVKRFHEPEK
jgi:DNA polymerase sigma